MVCKGASVLATLSLAWGRRIDVSAVATLAPDVAVAKPTIDPMVCTDIYGPGNLRCIKDVRSAFSERANQSLSESNDMMAIAGVSYENATIEDFQRASFCGISQSSCGAPPCECSIPPCHTCQAAQGWVVSDAMKNATCLCIFDYTYEVADASNLMLNSCHQCYLGAITYASSSEDMPEDNDWQANLLPFRQRMGKHWDLSDSPMLRIPDDGNVSVAQANIEDWYKRQGIGIHADSVRLLKGGEGLAPVSETDQCLCVFDVDRTLTSRPDSVIEDRPGGQWINSDHCPNTELATNQSGGRIYDPGYEGGNLSWAEATLKLASTHCSKCYIGIVSAGSAGRKGSEMRQEILEFIPSKQRLGVDYFNDGCPHPVTSPFVMSCKEGAKPVTTRDIQSWYRTRGIVIPNEKVFFYDDRLNNIESFEEHDFGFNAYQISCNVRDHFHGGAVGGCGMTAEEVSDTPGLHFCPREQVDCGPVEDPTNDACRPHIQWGFNEGKHHPKAHEWYMDFKKYTGVSYLESPMDDWQRAAYCGMNFQCGRPPCSCSMPPCDVCRVNGAA